MFWRKQRSIVKGLAAGAVGGLVGAWIMGYAHAAFGKVADELNRSEGDGSSTAPQHPKLPSTDQENATVKAAVAVAEAVGRELPPEQRERAGSVVHYAYGTLVGAAYGVAAEYSEAPGTGAGTAFGAALWLVSDEIAVPVLKLAKPPQYYSVEVHAAALAAHLVYGFTTEMIRRGVRAAAAR